MIGRHLGAARNAACHDAAHPVPARQPATASMYRPAKPVTNRSARAGSENRPLAVRSRRVLVTATYMAAKYPMRSPSAAHRSTIASSAPRVSAKVEAGGSATA